MIFRINAAGHFVDGIEVTHKDFWAMLKSKV